MLKKASPIAEPPGVSQGPKTWQAWGGSSGSRFGPRARLLHSLISTGHWPGVGRRLGTGCPTLVQPPTWWVTSGQELPFSEPPAVGFISLPTWLPWPQLCGLLSHQAADEGRGWGGAEVQEADGGTHQKGRKPFIHAWPSPLSPTASGQCLHSLRAGPCPSTPHFCFN